MTNNHGGAAIKAENKECEPLRKWFDALASLISYAIFLFLLSSDCLENLVTSDVDFLNRWSFVFSLLYIGVAALIGFGSMRFLYGSLKTKKPFVDWNRSPLFDKISHFLIMTILVCLFLFTLDSRMVWAPFVATFTHFWVNAPPLAAFFHFRDEIMLKCGDEPFDPQES